MHHPADRIAHTTDFVKPVVDHWLEREIAQWVPPPGMDPTTHHTISRSLNQRYTNTDILNKKIYLVSGQVRSECLTCTFRASCCSARLSRAQVLAFAGFVCPGQEIKKGGGGSKGVFDCTGGYKGVRAVRPESVAGGGLFSIHLFVI